MQKSLCCPKNTGETRLFKQTTIYILPVNKTDYI